MSKENLNKIARSVNENMPGINAITIITGRKFPKGVPDWVMMFQVVSKDLSKKLTPAGCKVLLYMISLMQYSNHIGVNQNTMAEDLEMSLRSVNGAVKELKEMGVVLSYKDPQDKTRNVYMINPHSAWKGKAQKRQNVLKAMDKNQTNLLDAIKEVEEEEKRLKG
jgi:DNA-binding MarR family transcriptional regulator